MDEDNTINKTVAFVKNTLRETEGGHDWWHIYRVWKNAQHIAKNEKDLDILVVELGSLLHDIADSKFHNGDEEIGPKAARDFLESLQIEEHVIFHVESIVRHVSFKGSLEGQTWTSPELSVVQDADRLDAIGAIGVARAFAYGGSKHREIYNPDKKPHLHDSFHSYARDEGTTINHFYEKLLLLKERMQTKTGVEMARESHDFMVRFLDRFFAEWNCKT